MKLIGNISKVIKIDKKIKKSDAERRLLAAGQAGNPLQGKRQMNEDVVLSNGPLKQRLFTHRGCSNMRASRISSFHACQLETL